jgi:isocitrate dehydrogenase kinase/phosphatase
MLVSECRFYELPEPDEDFPLMEHATTRFVGAHDIFPEEFIRFLAMPAFLRQTFLSEHSDLLTAVYWREVKRRRVAGEVAEIVPYARQSIAPQQISL